jgi:hypothetical protein
MTDGIKKEFVFSEFTALFLEETGWYKVERAAVEGFFWRQKEGCSITFATGSCKYGLGNPCNGEQDHCYYDNHLVAQCHNIRGYDRYGRLVESYYEDYCKWMTSGAFSFRDCRDQNSKKPLWSEKIGESYGEGSRCISGYVFSTSQTTTSFCLKTKCIGNTLKFTFNGQELTCYGQNQLLQLDDYGFPNGYITCPDVEDYCSKEAKRCPKDCSGNGRCSQIGKCYCYQGFKGLGCEKEVKPAVYKDPTKAGIEQVVDLKNYGPKFANTNCPKNCNGHGECNNKLSVCECDPYYSGYACQDFNVFKFFHFSPLLLLNLLPLTVMAFN